MAVYRLDLADKKLIDSVTDAESLSERIPRLETFFRDMAEKRKAMSRGGSYVGRFTKTTGFTQDGTMQYAATVPIAVFEAMVQVDPEFGTDEKKFIEWLRRNPQYAATERVP